MSGLKCLQCVSESIVHEAKIKRGEIPEGTTGPEERDGVTFAPSWQQQQVMGQMVMACVAVLTCREHLQVAEISPADQAVRNGRLIQARPQ
jgi:hypothetical protein